MFDHSKLAAALNKREIEASADNLPFSWISVDLDARRVGDEGEDKEKSHEEAKEEPTRKSVKFRIGDQKWQFFDDDPEGSADLRLVEYHGEFEEENLKPIKKEKVSEGSHVKTAIRFNNERDEISKQILIVPSFSRVVSLYEPTFRKHLSLEAWREPRLD